MVANEQFHNTGKLYGVGVGPGDPQLITLKAYNVLRQAPVVCVPQGNPGEAGYTWNIIKDLLDENVPLHSGSKQEILNLHFPMTHNVQELHKYWGQATEAIWQRLSTGLDCIFVTEGDPLLYGTFIHVYRLIRERYPQVAIEIIPGISSILAAAARAQIPLADGDDSIAILPATASYETLKLTLSRFDTIVLLKVNRAMGVILELLKELNLLDKAVFVSKVTSPDEEIVKQISQLGQRKIEYMSLIIVRK